MKKQLLIFSFVAVALLLIGLNYERIYNYLVWYVPLSKIDPSQIIYVSKEEGGSSNWLYSPAMKNVRYINDDSIEITFGKNPASDLLLNDFTFIKIVHKGDAFISLCHKIENSTTEHAVILQLTSINSTFVSFNHYETDLPKEIECKYPEIIERSFDIPWKIH